MKKDKNLELAGSYEEYNKWVRHNVIASIITIALALITLPFIFPLQVMIDGFGVTNSFSERFSLVGQYFSDIGNALILKYSLADVIQGYYGNWIKGVINGEYQVPDRIMSWIIWFSIVFITGVTGFALNNNRKTPNIYGDSRWATEIDIQKMEEKNLVGFKTKLFLVGKFKDKMIRMGETLSVLLLAPPGTGKSVGFIVPSAVTMDDASLFFHDQKPELFDMTSGHRKEVGPVFQLKWSAQDEPNGAWVDEERAKLLDPQLIETDENGNPVQDDNGLYKTKPIFYPSWNPLSPKSIPPAGPKRDMYIERLVNVLCPDPTGGGDKFWTSKARAALIGLIHFLVAKVEYASDPRFTGKGSWKGIPDQWIESEASFPMLVDWFAYAQNEYDDGSDDPMRQLFKAAVDEAKKMDEDFEKIYNSRVLNRAIVELTNLMNSPDKTRGSVIQTMDEALGSFKNEAVRQRTSHSDFAFYELRGMPTPEAKEREQEKINKAMENGVVYKPRYAKSEYKPISIYVSVSSEDAKAFSTITGIFVDAANAYLIANGPNQTDEQGNQLGPKDFVFLLDEAPQLPKLDTVINGPAVGRSKRVSYIIVGQDFGQFEQKYSKPEVETLKSTTAIKVILPQNNETTAKALSEMAGKITYTSYNLSEKSGDPKNPFSFLIKGKSASESMQQVEFLKPSWIMSMPSDKHVVLVQNYMNRPIFADTPKFFLDKNLTAKVYNLRAMLAGELDLTGKKYGPAPTLPMPKYMMDEAEERHNRRKKTNKETSEKRAALNDPRHVIIVTPKDIQSLTRDDFGEMKNLENTYACAEVFIHPDEPFIDLPDPDKILITDNVIDIANFVGGNKYFIFDQNHLEESINIPLQNEGFQGLSLELAEFISQRASAIGESPGQDIYFLGYQGGASLDIPDSPDEATPQFTINWIAEIITYILGVEDQKKLFELD